MKRKKQDRIYLTESEKKIPVCISLSNEVKTIAKEKVKEFHLKNLSDLFIKLVTDNNFRIKVYKY